MKNIINQIKKIIEDNKKYDVYSVEYKFFKDNKVISIFIDEIMVKKGLYPNHRYLKKIHPKVNENIKHFKLYGCKVNAIILCKIGTFKHKELYSKKLLNKLRNKK